MKKTPTAGIILAAGRSIRLGQPKQLVKIGDDILLGRVVESALNSDLDRVVLVLGHAVEKIKSALAPIAGHSKLLVIFNQKYPQGMSTSITAGLSAVQSRCPSIMVILGDQPLLDKATINLLLAHFHKSEKTICVPVCRGKRGLPVCFAKDHYADIMAIKGDIGAREVLRRNAGELLAVEVQDPSIFRDIDTPADLDKLAVELKKKLAVRRQ